jgi:hypothetical protein
MGSLSQLASDGLVKYVDRVIHQYRRISSLLQNSVVVIPFAPPPLCGISDPSTVRNLYDLSLWFDSTPDYPLANYNQALRDLLDSSSGPHFSHPPSRDYLPFTLEEYNTKLFERQGWQGLPEKIEPLTSPDEIKILTPLLEGLSCIFKLNIDCKPMYSRELVLKPAAILSSEKSALFVGGSNANHLANAAASLGYYTETITKSGWVLSTAAVSTILPEFEAYCLTLPPETPVVIYCLDNNSFVCADVDGQLSSVSKLADGLYHVVGELVVAHEVTLAASVTNLKRLIAMAGARMIFIITPLPRFLNMGCCEATTHCTHRLLPEAGSKILEDLRRLHGFIGSRLSTFTNVRVISGAELLTGHSSSSFDSILAAYSDWGAVHGPSTSYTRMALSLSDLISGKALSQEQPARPGNKRARSDSTGSSSSQSTQPPRPPRSIPVLGSSPYQQTTPGRGRGHNQMVTNPGGSRGGFRGIPVGRGRARAGRFQPGGYFGYRSRGGYDGGYGYYY